MQISELIERLEHIKHVTGDVRVVSTVDICGDECHTDVVHVSTDVCKRGDKLAIIEFARVW